MSRSAQSKDELEPDVRFLLAAKLHELDMVTAGQGGKLAGMPRLRFLEELGRRGFTVLHLDEEAIEDELKG